MKVARLGDKAFEQCAGFLRIKNGDNPLDGSSVHPESYPLVERIMATTQTGLGDLMGNAKVLRALNPGDFANENFGPATVKDILVELEKPGRDPRPEFKTAEFKDGVEKLSDLKPGMQLEGVVTNVANFGAFVDIGVHQDGLVHVSQLAEKFVKDPREVVKAGDIVKVKVMAIDQSRKRIGLSMRLDDKAEDQPAAGEQRGRGRPAPERRAGAKKDQPAAGGRDSSKPSGAFAAAFAKAKHKR